MNRVDHGLSILIMTADSESRFPIEVVLVIIATMVAICVLLVFVGPELFSEISRPAVATFTPTPVNPSSPTRQYSPEIIPVLTDTPDLARAAVPTQTSTPVSTPTFTPTIASLNVVLPDLAVTGISDPVCLPDRVGSIVEFNIYVRNIGRVSTRSFGAFDVRVFLILGERQYGLDEWAEKFNGVIGTTNMRISSLNPGKDSKLTVALDLKANSQFGIKAVANVGTTIISESDTSNNTLIKYFSVYCY